MNKIFELLLGVMTWGRSILTFVVLILFSLILFQSSNETKGQVIQALVSSILFPVQSTVQWVDELKLIESKNARLLEENAILRLKIDTYRQAEKENQRLRDYLKFPRRLEMPVVVAQVVSRDPGRLQSSLVINKGKVDGMKVSMPVLLLREW